MLNRLFAFALLAVGFATAARADYIPATWTDNANIGSGTYIGDSQFYTYTHDLTDNGFRPLTDWISDFRLKIDVADNADDWEVPEVAFIDLPGWFGDGFVTNFDVGGQEFGGWSIFGLLELNILGTLTVTISSFMGDFNLIGSTLTATGLAHVSSVPEPGALGLLGIGLMGMALSMRRRKLARN